MRPLLSVGPFSCWVPGRSEALLHGIRVELFENDLVVLSGRSGSGKTTLLKVVAGLLPGSSGVERVLNGERFEASWIRRWRSKVLYVGQDPVLVGTNVWEAVTQPFSLASASRRTIDKGALDELLQGLGVEGALDRDPRSLSGGEKRRVALARAFLWDPDVLLLDEPLANLDDSSAKLCAAAVREFAARPGRAVMAAAHERRELLGGRSLELVGGKLICR